MGIKDFILPPTSADPDSRIDWPNLVDDVNAQCKSKNMPGKRFQHKDGIIKDDLEIFCIPQYDASLKFRITFAAHTDIGGYGALETNLTTIRIHFHWEAITKDVQGFLHSCIHCFCTFTGGFITKPLSKTVNGSRSNYLIHLDYSYRMLVQGGFCYVLIPKNYFSGYFRFIATENTDAVTTADAPMRWFSTFRFIRNWVSDQASHSKNELLKSLPEASEVNHHLTQRIACAQTGPCNKYAAS